MFSQKIHWWKFRWQNKTPKTGQFHQCMAVLMPHLEPFYFQRAGPVMRAVNSTLWLRSCPASTSIRRTRACRTISQQTSASMESQMDQILATLVTTSATQVTLLLQIPETFLGLQSTSVLRFLSRRLFCSTGENAVTAGQGILQSQPPTSFQILT